ncbi:MAG: protein-glutamate O-methyltransferase CheR [Ignavibacteriaceae bacterium]
MKKITDKISELLLSAYGMDITRFDESFLEKAIANHASKADCKTIEEYSKLLQQKEKEARILVDSLSINYSEFFRNPVTYAYLEQQVFPQLAENKIKKGEKEIRIWSAACAAGQEPYTISIICSELKDSVSYKINTFIFGTDNNKAELRKAQAGVYQSSSLGRVPLKYIEKYFTKNGNSYTLHSSVSENVLFSAFDLFSETDSCPPISIYGNFDMIFCANVLFYYKDEYRKLIMKKLSNSLAGGGYLITGETERNFVMRNNYREVFPTSGIFQKKYISGMIL